MYQQAPSNPCKALVRCGMGKVTEFVCTCVLNSVNAHMARACFASLDSPEYYTTTMKRLPRCIRFGAWVAMVTRAASKHGATLIVSIVMCSSESGMCMPVCHKVVLLPRAALTPTIYIAELVHVVIVVCCTCREVGWGVSVGLCGPSSFRV